MAPLDDEAKPWSKADSLKRGERRTRRDVAGPKRRAEIVAAKGQDGCRLCGRYPVTFHHLVPRGSPYFGSDTEANWIALCGSGTTGCHGKIEMRNREAMRKLVEGLTDAEYSFAVEHGGENFFERRYLIRYERA